MASVLDDLGFSASELLDTHVWIEGAKAAAGGAAAIIATGKAVAFIPWVKDQDPTVKALIRGALSIAGAIFARPYVGDAVASGMVGGGAGFALAKVVEEYLPASLKGGLGDGSYDMGSLTQEERALLSDIPGESLSEVSVEDHIPGLSPGLSEVSVEDHIPGLSPGLNGFGDLSALGISAVS